MSNLALLPKLLSQTDSVVFVEQGDSQFELISDVPQWAHSVIPELSQPGDTVQLEGKIEFLDFFLEDAKAYWLSPSNDPLYSDEWVHRKDGNQELPMAAIALSIDGYAVLLLKSIEQRYKTMQKVHQHARESLLNNELLEAEVRRRTKIIRQREQEISVKLLSAAAERDQETGLHIRRIALYAAALAEELGWSTQRVDDIRLAAPMHDVGKIGIPDSILLKPGKLDPDEITIMRKHVLIGAKMLEGTDIPLLDMAHEIALHHHERWDGRGYPHGLKGEDIPESARIVSIVDVYDALSSRRVYKAAFSEEDTLRMMHEEKGKHFDPAIFDAFMRIFTTILKIKIELSDPEPELDLSRLNGTE